jgi:hypothetical protein
VRDGPPDVGAVAREAAADLVVDPARRHGAQRLHRHRPAISGAVEQVRQHRGLGELRRTPEAAVDRVEALAQRAHRTVERAALERRRARAQPRPAAQGLDHPRRLVLDVRPPRAPRLVDGEQDLPPRRQSAPRLRREVRAAEERHLRPGVAKTFSGHPPCPVIAWTASMYSASTSGRSSRSTFTQTKRAFITAATSASSKDSRSMTWHQWHAE